MRLLKVRFENFRRLKGPCSLDVDESLVALVGPNEAGKSSALRAIAMLLDDESPTDRDVTRGTRGPAEIAGLFLLSDDDRLLLAGIHDGAKVERAWVHRRNGVVNATWRFEPYPRRDPAPRSNCRALVDALQGDPALDGAYSGNQDDPWNPQLFVDVLEALSSDAETLDEGVPESFESLATRLGDLVYPPFSEPEDSETDELDETAATEAEARDARDAARTALVALARTEREPRPAQQVRRALNDRLPSVAFFKPEDRELQTTYVLSEIVDDPPNALQNLCQVAGLDIRELANAWETDKPHVERQIETANALVKERFQTTWNQSTVYPRFGAPSDGVLRLYISTEGEASYSEVQERSEGLRWFLALDAFLAARGRELPVLLVDEAETHLHYDAASGFDRRPYAPASRGQGHLHNSLHRLPASRSWTRNPGRIARAARRGIADREQLLVDRSRRPGEGRLHAAALHDGGLAAITHGSTVRSHL